MIGPDLFCAEHPERPLTDAGWCNGCDCGLAPSGSAPASPLRRAVPPPPTIPRPGRTGMFARAAAARSPRGGFRGSKFKHDGGKAPMDLVPWDAVEGVAMVLEYGARKYQPHSWRRVEDGKGRYFAAALRHLIAHLRGEVVDPESGLPHVDHAACNVLFLASLMRGEVNR
ncbi:MAG: dATP/dGTP diphosphohydrolase domain-containing protein [Myxococcota bacterium]